VACVLCLLAAGLMKSGFLITVFQAYSVQAASAAYYAQCASSVTPCAAYSCCVGPTKLES
jgi:hypothetical protein